MKENKLFCEDSITDLSLESLNSLFPIKFIDFISVLGPSLTEKINPIPPSFKRTFEELLLL